MYVSMYLRSIIMIELHFINLIHLSQELIRYNRLLAVVSRTLHGVNLASQGLAIMSAELEQCNNAFIKGVVPAGWMSKSYPSMKSLGSYVADFLAR